MRIIWALKFARTYMYIFSKPEGAFTARWSSAVKTGWKVYPNRKHQSPSQAALDEITEWFS
jgi:hypothetical protein